MFVLFLMPLIFAAGILHAQQTVSGIVVDSATMSGLPAVNVQVKNSFRGTTTDEKGNFSIQATENDTLVFTLVGYERLELPLFNYEPGMIRLSEKYTLLQAITIDEYRRQNLYEGMFDEENARFHPKIPFYFSKAKKEKIKVAVLREENLHVKTYVDMVILNPDFKRNMMQKYQLAENEYYNILRAFNERHHEVMYHLTQAELLSLLNTFFDAEVKR